MLVSISIAAFVVAAVGLAIACISFGYQLGKDVANKQK